MNTSRIAFFIVDLHVCRAGCWDALLAATASNAE
jgi:hypothetical protein